MGKHWFYNGEKYEILKSCFWPETIINLGPPYNKRCRIAKFGRVSGLIKVDFVNIVLRKSWFKTFVITMGLHCIHNHLKSWFSIWKYWQNQLLWENVPPKCCNSVWYTVDQYWLFFSGQKRDLIFFLIFFPILKSMFSHYNIKKKLAMPN